MSASERPAIYSASIEAQRAHFEEDADAHAPPQTTVLKTVQSSAHALDGWQMGEWGDEECIAWMKKRGVEEQGMDSLSPAEFFDAHPLLRQAAPDTSCNTCV